MQFSYMKIAIYVLTFLTYAYSGYGSSMIASLRDAIIGCEAIFGDVFKNFIFLSKKFKVVHDVFDAAVEENCIFKCPGGKYLSYSVRSIDVKVHVISFRYISRAEQVL